MKNPAVLLLIISETCSGPATAARFHEQGSTPAAPQLPRNRNPYARENATTTTRNKRSSVPPCCACARRSSFQAQGFGDPGDEYADDGKSDYKDGDGIDDEAGGKGNGGRRGAGVADQSQTGLMLFSKIVREFIIDGAPNEINIRCAKLLLSAVSGGSITPVGSLCGKWEAE